MRRVLACIWFFVLACQTPYAGGAEMPVQGFGAGNGHGGAQGFIKEGELVFMSPQGAVRSKIDVEIAETVADRAVRF